MAEPGLAPLCPGPTCPGPSRRDAPCPSPGLQHTPCNVEFPGLGAIVHTPEPTRRKPLAGRAVAKEPCMVPCTIVAAPGRTHCMPPSPGPAAAFDACLLPVPYCRASCWNYELVDRQRSRSSWLRRWLKHGAASGCGAVHDHKGGKGGPSAGKPSHDCPGRSGTRARG